MKILAAVIFIFALFQQQSCSTSGPMPMRIVPLPTVTCDQAYTGQFVTGGVPPYQISIQQITDPSGTAIDSMPGLSIAIQGGSTAPLKSNTSVNNSTGYIVGSVPCSYLTAQSQRILLAGMPLDIRKPL